MKNSFFYILLTAVLFTTLEPVSKLIAADVSPLAMTFIRFFIGGAMLLPFAVTKLRKNNMKLSAKDFITLALLGVLCICISMLMLQVAVLKADSPALIAIIFCSNSVFTILLATVFLKEKMTVKKALAMILCIAGVLVLADFSSGTNVVSILLAVGAALTFSLYTVLSKKYSAKLSGVIQTGFSFFFGSLVLLVILLFTGESIFSGLTTGKTIGIMLYLGVAVTGLGYWAFFRAMEKSSATAASTAFFIKPILTPFAAFFINGIAPAPKVFAALILVVAGSVLASMPTKQMEPSEQHTQTIN
ncbi:MAG: hypothetical protein EGR97_01620 [Clostridiales bacterium]|nr:hypothetical protein [Clostridiales bacterium]